MNNFNPLTKRSLRFDRLRHLILNPLLRTTSVLAVLLLTIAGTFPGIAHATQNQMCGSGGTGWCMNLDGGVDKDGTAIINWYGGASYENFLPYTVLRCNNGSVDASTGCPFSDTALDSTYNGDAIVEVKYNGGSNCVSDAYTSSTIGDAYLGSCPPTGGGSGGSDGTVFVEAGSSSCPLLHNLMVDDAYFINVYASDYYGEAVGQQVGSGLGAQQYASSSYACWNNP